MKLGTEDNFDSFNLIDKELEDMSITDTYYNFCLDKLPSEIFSEDKFLVFTLSHNCYCYENFDPLRNKLIYVYVKVDNYELGERITYGLIFYEIDKQMKAHYQEIADKCGMELKDIYCNHMFIESFDKETPIQYSVFCGS
jgi:hypothetical protein